MTFVVIKLSLKNTVCKYKLLFSLFNAYSTMQNICFLNSFYHIEYISDYKKCLKDIYVYMKCIYYVGDIFVIIKRLMYKVWILCWVNGCFKILLNYYLCGTCSCSDFTIKKSYHTIEYSHTFGTTVTESKLFF